MFNLPLLLLMLAILQAQAAPNFMENFLERKGMGDAGISALSVLKYTFFLEFVEPYFINLTAFTLAICSLIS